MWVKFYRGTGKYNDDVIMTSFHIVGIEICIFSESEYMLSGCQVSSLSVLWIKFYRGWSNFTEVG